MGVGGGGEEEGVVDCVAEFAREEEVVHCFLFFDEGLVWGLFYLVDWRIGISGYESLWALGISKRYALDAFCVLEDGGRKTKDEARDETRRY